MSEGRATVSTAHRVGSGAGRVLRAWRALPHERRLAAYAAFGLFVTMFLPWYQRQFFASVAGKFQPVSDSQTAWANFSFVEAAVLLVAGGVLTLLFQRAEGRAFHIPGGDGGIITAAGAWTCALIVWRIFDKQGGAASGQNVISYGIEWGIFVALAVAASLAYAGTRIRAAHRPEPPLPGEEGPPEGGRLPPDPSEPPARPASARPASEPPAPEPPPPEPPPPERAVFGGSSHERRVGWLTERRSDQADGAGPSDAAARPVAPPRPVAAPRPIPSDDAPTVRRAADDAPTVRRIPDPTAPLPPSTPAARRQRDDEQLTIPLDGH